MFNVHVLLFIFTHTHTCIHTHSQEDSRYDQGTDVRGQLKVLERIDELSTARKQEREKEKILRAARSRSKQDDPEIAKMKEQAKQVLKTISFTYIYKMYMYTIFSIHLVSCFLVPAYTCTYIYMYINCIDNILHF